MRAGASAGACLSRAPKSTRSSRWRWVPRAASRGRGGAGCPPPRPVRAMPIRADSGADAPGLVRRLTAPWRRVPDLLIIGARCCGTTSLVAYLRAHPAVEWAAVKEVHFFDDNFERGLGW